MPNYLTGKTWSGEKSHGNSWIWAKKFIFIESYSKIIYHFSDAGDSNESWSSTITPNKYPPFFESKVTVKKPQ